MRLSEAGESMASATERSHSGSTFWASLMTEANPPPSETGCGISWARPEAVPEEGSQAPEPMEAMPGAQCLVLRPCISSACNAAASSAWPSRSTLLLTEAEHW